MLQDEMILVSPEAIQTTSGNLKLNRESSQKIQDDTYVARTGDRGVHSYTVVMFERRFNFLAKPDLTGSDIYCICENLYCDADN